MHSHVLSILFAIFVCALVVVKSIININQSAQRGRGCMAILSTICLVLFLGATLFTATLHLFFKVSPRLGLWDSGALEHAQHVLEVKYGKGPNAACKIDSFVPETVDPGATYNSGVYHIKYSYGDHHGEMLCHFDRPHWLFDSDTVQDSD